MQTDMLEEKVKKLKNNKNNLQQFTDKYLKIIRGDGKQCQILISKN